MIIVNTPHNPVGKVFTKAELEGIAAIAEEFNLLVMADEVVRCFFASFFFVTFALHKPVCTINLVTLHFRHAFLGERSISYAYTHALLLF